MAHNSPVKRKRDGTVIITTNRRGAALIRDALRSYQRFHDAPSPEERMVELIRSELLKGLADRGGE